MSFVEKACIVIGRLPLLFLVDSVLKGTFMDFSDSNFLIDSFSETYKSNGTQEDIIADESQGLLSLLLWFFLRCIATMASLVLICSPIVSLLKVYACCLGFGLLCFSYHCNTRLIYGTPKVGNSLESKILDDNNNNSSGDTDQPEELQTRLIIINLLTQLFIVLAFDQICIMDSLYRNKAIAKYARFPTDVLLFLSVTFPVILSSCVGEDNVFYKFSPELALLFPFVMLLIHSTFVILTVIGIVIPAMRYVRIGMREIGFDGLLMRVTEIANLSWLLRTFFITKVIYQILTSNILSDSQDVSTWWESLSVGKSLVMEVLHAMCGTILSVMSMASIVSIVSGWGLRVVYRIIGAQDEEESLQPAVSGFLFVLLAMQTGITSISSDARLQLLFQNCILLLVANQHFVQTVAADLILKASTDDTDIKKHVRLMLPYLIFFSFPFVVVSRLWEYPFRISWLLAISAFSLELIIKSVSTLAIYTLNMVQSHTNYLHDRLEDLIFYIKAVCGCLEFTCGIFLFFNGAYIFIFESGGVIRLVMMIIHFYCNIYQTAVKGVATYKLRLSAWEKVNKLQAASQEQLDDNDDICPICYQEMTEAVVIKCSHVFHKGCLQKWLSIQEKCPLCHVDLTDSSSPAANNNVQQPAR